MVQGLSGNHRFPRIGWTQFCSILLTDLQLCDQCCGIDNTGEHKIAIKIAVSGASGRAHNSPLLQFLSGCLSSQLYALDQSIFNSNSGQAILSLLNTLNLHINSYLLTPNYPYRNALTLITNQLVPSFNAFITNTLRNYTSNFSSPASRTALLICLALLCLAFLVLLWVISFRQGMRRREVA